ncbi:hypothetical protein [Mesorhizobium huakuii]|uniref:Uncharacterized protein n=1 Tax=Mesorhizobium huakuii TaxID=28104 RepID=A0A7G6T4Y7_9HYPH|nr:hypothetical protein [Mesorhizobium huakuii]QND61819.1 hypothetical protein HB778_37105 [Mesorhizobium huakuii]QND69089.1 hypothetical protein HB777_35330 [Mesorhizobium loti]
MAYRRVVEVSSLLTHMRGASDVSSHSSGAFPSGGFDLHTWPDPWFGLFLAREKLENWGDEVRPLIGHPATKIVQYRVAGSPVN